MVLRSVLFFSALLLLQQPGHCDEEYVRKSLASWPEPLPADLPARAEAVLEKSFSEGRWLEAEQWARDLIALPRHPRNNALDLCENGLPYSDTNSLALVGRKALIRSLAHTDPARFLLESKGPWLSFCDLPFERARLARAQAEALSLLGRETQARKAWEAVKEAAAAWELEAQARIDDAIQRKLHAGHSREPAEAAGRLEEEKNSLLRKELDPWLMAPLPPKQTITPPKKSTAKSLWTPPAAPPWTLPDAAGKPHSLADFKGRPLLINFYIDHACERCLEQLGELATHQEKFGKLGITVIVIGQDKPGDLGKLQPPALKGTPFPYLNLSDPECKTFAAYHVFNQKLKSAQHGLVLIDSQGKIRWHDSAEGPFRDVFFLEKELRRQLKLSAMPINR